MNHHIDIQINGSVKVNFYSQSAGGLGKKCLIISLIENFFLRKFGNIDPHFEESDYPGLYL